MYAGARKADLSWILQGTDNYRQELEMLHMCCSKYTVQHLHVSSQLEQKNGVGKLATLQNTKDWGESTLASFPPVMRLVL